MYKRVPQAIIVGFVQILFHRKNTLFPVLAVVFQSILNSTLCSG